MAVSEYRRTLSVVLKTVGKVCRFFALHEKNNGNSVLGRKWVSVKTLAAALDIQESTIRK